VQLVRVVPVQAIGSDSRPVTSSWTLAPDAVITPGSGRCSTQGLKSGLSLRINATHSGTIIMLAVRHQDGGILRSANTTKILGISAVIL